MSGKTKKVFGQATRYQRQQGKGSAKNTHSATQLTEEQERAQRILQLKLKRRAEDEALDERFGYSRYSNNTGDGSRSKRGWIFNILPTVSAIKQAKLRHFNFFGVSHYIVLFYLFSTDNYSYRNV